MQQHWMDQSNLLLLAKWPDTNDQHLVSIAQAGCDLLADRGTEILAIENGTIIQGPYCFYSSTYALEVKHDSGIVVRYGEILQTVPRGISPGARVSKGQVIAHVAKYWQAKVGRRDLSLSTIACALNCASQPNLTRSIIVTQNVFGIVARGFSNGCSLSGTPF